MRKPGAKAFIIYDKKLLLILRDNKPDIPSPNTWGLPGGGVEEGETELEALKRELEEEISIAPKTIIYLGKQTYPDGTQVNRYLIRLDKNEYQQVRLGKEGQELNFFTVDEAKHLALSHYFKEYFFRYFDQLKKLVEENAEIEPKLLGLDL